MIVSYNMSVVWFYVSFNGKKVSADNSQDMN